MPILLKCYSSSHTSWKWYTTGVVYHSDSNETTHSCGPFNPMVSRQTAYFPNICIASVSTGTCNISISNIGYLQYPYNTNPYLIDVLTIIIIYIFIIHHYFHNIKLWQVDVSIKWKWVVSHQHFHMECCI